MSKEVEVLVCHRKGYLFCKFKQDLFKIEYPMLAIVKVRVLLKSTYESFR